MTSAIKIYHNPRCSKSRQTLQLLESNGIAPQIIEYLKQPPSVDELAKVIDLLDIPPRELMRTQEKPYRENNLADPALCREDLIRAMTEHPILIERPIVVHDGRAVIGRPPENILDLI
ncbi:MAG: arsenate reductase (glutaredoxin) [Gammaproteobacteria bacterium]|nr:arsenate reductase (glutaredoxin) [Gammaproteobacteria bacterium]